MDRSQRGRVITRLCEASGCGPKIAKIHFEQFVNRDWHPHPPDDFKAWWIDQQDFRQGIDVKRAYNYQRYRDQFLESKQYGAA